MRAVIIEDELRSQKVLGNLLNMSCPEISIIGYADSVQSGISLINEKSPELVFLDIHLSDGSGFEILEQLDNLRINVIFTTAYDHYAIRAFKFSTIDYLIKPIDSDELKRAVEKCLRQNEFNLSSSKLQGLMSNLNLKNQDDPTISISTSESIEFIKIRDIIRCEAQGAYSTIHFSSEKSLLISKVIKELEQILAEYHFQRIHQTHLVNLLKVEKYLRRENMIKLSDGTKLPLARSRKDQFFKAMKQLKH